MKFAVLLVCLSVLILSEGGLEVAGQKQKGSSESSGQGGTQSHTSGDHDDGHGEDLDHQDAGHDHDGEDSGEDSNGSSSEVSQKSGGGSSGKEAGGGLSRGSVGTKFTKP